MLWISMGNVDGKPRFFNHLPALLIVLVHALITGPFPQIELKRVRVFTGSGLITGSNRI